MSLQNHPNFHACKFITDIVSSYYESLRGKATVENCPDIQNEVRRFVMKIEEKVDKAVKPSFKLIKGNKS